MKKNYLHLFILLILALFCVSFSEGLGYLRKNFFDETPIKVKEISNTTVNTISIFDINIFLPGNGCMAQRSSLFMENGLSVSQVIIIDIIIIVITLIIQLKIISVKDIL